MMTHPIQIVPLAMSHLIADTNVQGIPQVILTLPNGYNISIVEICNPVQHFEYIVIDHDDNLVGESEWINADEVAGLIIEISLW
jgi:hypothetical protein